MANVQKLPMRARSVQSGVTRAWGWAGQLVDASIVAAPKQRNTQAEKQAIKAGRVPEEWQEQPAKLRQKDRDARWTVKTTTAKPREGGPPLVDLAIPEFGYQNHISADRRHRLIRRWLVTDAAAHAGAGLADLLDPGNTASAVWAETGYRSKKNEELLRQRMLKSHIHGKKPSGRPMPERTAPGACEELGGPRPRRARLRRAEGRDGPLGPDHRPGSGDHQDRACQPGPQGAPPALAATPAGSSPDAPAPPKPPATAPPQPTAADGLPLPCPLCASTSPENAVDGGLQLALDLASAGNGVVVFTSSTGREVAYEDRRWENGAFTEALLEVLAGKARPGGRHVSVSDLKRYLRTRVIELTDGAQKPQVWNETKLEVDAPIFVVR